MGFLDLFRERRKTDDRRRQDGAPPGGRERRQGDRADRRRLRHGVEYTTSDSFEALEAWLDKNCEGKRHMVLKDVDDAFTKKTVVIMFELETDKLRFVRKFAVRKS